MRRFRLIILSLALGMSVPAHTQTTQTAANAQEFMRLTFLNGSTKVAIKIGQNDWNKVLVRTETRKYECEYVGGVRMCGNNYYAGTAYRYIELSPTKVNVYDNCQITIYHRITKSPSEPFYHANPAGEFSGISWKNVTGVTQEGNSVYLAGEEYKVFLSSEELATRFAYAAKFLRDACDPTAATGF